MAAEVKKEIQLEIAHVLFIDIVGYSKLSINEQHALVEELNEVVRASDQFQRAEAADRLLKTRPGMEWRWSSIPVPKGLRSARWRSAARSRNIRACMCAWAFT